MESLKKALESIHDNEVLYPLALAEYEMLMEKYAFLECLEACGVDNWDGYSEAWKMLRDGWVKC